MLHARTKIVATVGPSCSQQSQLSKLVEAGVSVFRINMAHGHRQQHEEIVRSIRAVSSQQQRTLGILVDLAGPKIRLGKLVVDPTHLAYNTECDFIRAENASASGELGSTYPTLVDELSVGDRVMLADGTVSLTVIKVSSDRVRCRVVDPGLIRSRQGINLPGVKLTVPAMTEEDQDNAVWAARNGIDFVGLSFVRTPVEVRQLKQMLLDEGSEALVIAKIEKREALENLDGIVAVSDGVMVARGDLGVETDVAEMPMAQKRIISMCNRFGRPVIVATQMLDSMQHSRQPTRAEVTDVANAILDGADACMLSGETAVGKHPQETVEMMHRVMLSTEATMSTPTQSLLPQSSDGDQLAEVPMAGVHPVTSAVVYGAARIARHLFAKLVVIATRSGATALAKSSQRNLIPTVAVSDRPETLQKISLFWGITPLAGAPALDGPQLRGFINSWGQAQGILNPGDRVVMVAGSGIEPGVHNQVVVHEVGSRND